MEPPEEAFKGEEVLSEYLAGQSQDGEASANYPSDCDDEAFEEQVEVFLRHVGPEVVNKGQDLAESKDTQSQHVLTGLNRLEADEADLHGE
jgi:hypothetical protein